MAVLGAFLVVGGGRCVAQSETEVTTGSRLFMCWCANNDISVVTVVRRRAKNEHSATQAQFASHTRNIDVALLTARTGGSVDEDDLGRTFPSTFTMRISMETRGSAHREISTGDRPQLSMRVLRGAGFGCDRHGQRD